MTTDQKLKKLKKAYEDAEDSFRIAIDRRWSAPYEKMYEAYELCETAYKAYRNAEKAYDDALNKRGMRAKRTIE